MVPSRDRLQRVPATRKGMDLSPLVAGKEKVNKTMETMETRENTHTSP